MVIAKLIVAGILAVLFITYLAVLVLGCLDATKK